MVTHVIEVVARFGDTILDVAYVGPDAAYRMGTAPDVQLAVQGHTSFPLVADGRIRCPLGVASREQGGTTIIELGHVTVELTRGDPPASRITRPRPGARLPAFALASLIVHVGLWLCAITLQPFEQLVESQRPRMRFVHVAEHAERRAEPAATAIPASEHRHPPAKLVRDLQPRVAEGVTSVDPSTPAEAAARLAAMVASTNVVDRVNALRPEDTYDEDGENAKRFGGARRFDPPAETIKTSEYELMLFDAKLCPGKTCTITGPVPASFVRAQLHEHMAAIYDCYIRHSMEPGTIVLEFTIAGDGSVHNARGRGLGETGACAARVLPQIYFKAIGDNDVPEGQPKVTRVRYPIRFN